MFGLGRNVTLALVGWLWADLLLGMFAIFLAANSASAAVAQTPQNAIDPQVFQIQITIDGPTLLSINVPAVQQEQARIAKAVSDQLQSQKDRAGSRLLWRSLPRKTHLMATRSRRRRPPISRRAPSRARSSSHTTSS